jgi:hypothetical protein
MKKTTLPKESGYMRPEDIINTVISLAPHAEICHHIPGRIRLRILPSGFSTIERSGVFQTIHSIPGVMNQRISFHSKSIVIEYDRKQIPYDLWELLGQIRNKPELAKVATDLMRFLWT